MADYKGTIKFIGEQGDWALVEEYKLTENVATSTGIGTGDGSETSFSGTLSTIVEEGELTLKVGGVDQSITDASGVITGATITTSTGRSSTINYETGALQIYFAPASAPGSGSAVVMEYQYSSAPTDFDRHRLVKGSFSSRSVGDSIYYDYATFSDFNDGYNVTETYES